MVIYGWNTKTIKQAPLPDYECPHCQQKQSQIAITAYYAHLFWIPVFPYKKTAAIVCGNCKHVTEEGAITSGTTVSIKQLKAAVPVPKYLFSGLVLIVIGIGYLIYQNNENAARRSAYVSDPKVGDVYLLKTKKDTVKYNHYLMKVREINGDSLLVSFSSYSYNGRVEKLDPNDGFYNVVYSIHKNGIEDYHTTGELLEVMRDYDATAGFDRDIEFPMADSVGDDLLQ
jgi:hypothetical protein